MKKIIHSSLLASILLTSIAVFSQGELNCKMTEPEKFLATQGPCGTTNFSAQTDPAVLETYDPVIYNIYFWQIVKDDGTADILLNENDILAAVAKINIEFNKANIFFKYKGFNNTSYKSTTHYDGAAPGTHIDYAGAHGHVDTNAFNVYVAKSIAGASGYASAWQTNVVLTTQSLRFSGPTTNKPTLLHELGHCFVLAHLNFRHENSQGELEECEHVTRDPNDTDDPNDPNDTWFNADEAGDRVVDTPAQLLIINSGPNANASSNCEYIGQDQDCQGTDMEISPYDLSNWMVNTNGCQTRTFTTGQRIRMREATTQDAFCNFVDAIPTNGFAALYEPYEGQYYWTGPPVPGMFHPLFQPGFDYKFIRCYGDYDQPAAYGDTSFSFNSNIVLLSIDKNYDQNNYYDITHPNRSAIIIEQLPASFGTGPDIGGPRKCYNNGQSYDFARSGSVTHFRDGVPNANVTITPMDSTQINNPQLINNLQPGLYNIEKTYIDGSTEENMILKEN